MIAGIMIKLNTGYLNKGLYIRKRSKMIKKYI